MIRANLFAFAFNLSDFAGRKRPAVKAAARSESQAANERNLEGDDDRWPGYLYSEGVFWGVHLPY